MSFNQTVQVLQAALEGASVVDRLYVATEFVRLTVSICTYFALRGIKNSLERLAREHHYYEEEDE